MSIGSNLPMRSVPEDQARLRPGATSPNQEDAKATLKNLRKQRKEHEAKEAGAKMDADIDVMDLPPAPPSPQKTSGTIGGKTRTASTDVADDGTAAKTNNEARQSLSTPPPDVRSSLVGKPRPDYGSSASAPASAAVPKGKSEEESHEVDPSTYTTTGIPYYVSPIDVNTLHLEEPPEEDKYRSAKKYAGYLALAGLIAGAFALAILGPTWVQDTRPS